MFTQITCQSANSEHDYIVCHGDNRITHLSLPRQFVGTYNHQVPIVIMHVHACTCDEHASMQNLFGTVDQSKIRENGIHPRDRRSQEAICNRYWTTGALIGQLR